jgi:hypothetical protein
MEFPNARRMALMVKAPAKKITSEKQADMKMTTAFFMVFCCLAETSRAKGETSERKR